MEIFHISSKRFQMSSASNMLEKILLNNCQTKKTYHMQISVETACYKSEADDFENI